MNRLIFGRSTDPWHNLAFEELLFLQNRGEGVLYLWQNRNTVVIGRNQNAWRECRTDLLEAEGGKLARRSSGGGAVFHDLGNLNFTFIFPKERYDLVRQCGVITAALSRFGIRAQLSGRNDLILETGEKFSGNAFRHSPETSLQHGTLLVSADMEKLGRYLHPSPLKLEAKGITSVRSRVKNLCECLPGLTIPALKEALCEAFADEYGPAAGEDESAADPEMLRPLEEKYASWEWRYGQAPAFNVRLEQRFSWGEVQLLLFCREGRVENANVYTDALDETLSARAQELLSGTLFRPDALAGALSRLGGQEGTDLAELALTV